MEPQPSAVPQAITKPPVIPPHIHWYGPCRKAPFGGGTFRYCVIYPGCRSMLRC